MTLDVIDTFSGIGGFAVGLETAGMRTVAFCEKEPIRRHLLAHHWPGVPIYDDIKTLTGERLERDGIRARVVVGGFPCQDISFAGDGAGLDGERSGLFFELARLVREVGPDFVVLENVAALLVRGLGAVLRELAALGFDLWWDCIPASATLAPHRRDRIWIIAYPRGQQYQGFGDALRRSIAAQLHGYAYASGEPDGPFDEEAPWGEGDVPDSAWDDAGWPDPRSERERTREGGEPLAGPDSERDGREPWRPGDAAQGEARGEPDRTRVGDDVPDADADLQPTELVGGGDRRQASRSEGGDPGEGQASDGEWLRPEPGSGGEVLSDTQDHGPERRARGPGDDPEAVGGGVDHQGGGDSDGGDRPRLHAYCIRHGECFRPDECFGLVDCILARPYGANVVADAVDPPDAGVSGLPVAELETLCGEGWWDERRATAERGWRLAESDMGGMADGFPTRLDTLHGGFQEEPPIPRVAKEIPARVGRLAGLGDSVVPQIPAMLGRAILDAMEECGVT